MKNNTFIMFRYYDVIKLIILFFRFGSDYHDLFQEIEKVNLLFKTHLKHEERQKWLPDHQKVLHWITKSCKKLIPKHLFPQKVNIQNIQSIELTKSGCWVSSGDP